MRPSHTKILTAVLLASAAAAAATLPQTKELKPSDGYKYVYSHVAATGENATVLLIHGYPATRHDWANQIEDLSAAGYGVIAPDCLGYGDSDRPTEVRAYNLKQISNNLMEILDKEGLDKVVGVGHDWGTNVLSRTTVWHPHRFEKLAFLSLGYSAPGVFLDIDALNAYSLANLGYLQFGYFYSS
jgi:soluble epoxide hydrolase / lipid-phosphate phosphatase